MVSSFLPQRNEEPFLSYVM